VIVDQLWLNGERFTQRNIQPTASAPSELHFIVEVLVADHGEFGQVGCTQQAAAYSVVFLYGFLGKDSVEASRKSATKWFQQSYATDAA
jgi:hypothetical protein